MANRNTEKRSFEERTQSNLSRGTSYNRKQGASVARARSKSVCESAPSLRELLTDAESQVGSLKEQQQSLTNELIGVRSEQKALLLTIEFEFESIQKLIEQKKAQLLFSINTPFETYLEEIIELGERLEREVSVLETSIETTKAPAENTGLSLLEIEDKMDSARSELEDSMRGEEVSRARSNRPRITYHSQEECFRQLVDNIGWVEQQLESSSILEVLVPPSTPKEATQFSPVGVATDPAGTVYVLDDGKEGGSVHVFVEGVWTESINLLKETKLKKIPNSLCVARDSIYVSYPEADTIAVTWRKNREHTKLLTPHSFPSLKPGLRSPHGLARLDREGVVVADTGNDRVVVLNKSNQVARTIVGTPHAPLHRPVSVGACSDGLIAVLHSGGSRVHVYTADGELRWRTCSFEARDAHGELTPCVPIRISLHKTGEFKEPEELMTAVYSVEQCVLRYNLQKMQLGKMGKTGKKFGQFSDLRGVEYCPEKQTILACDYGNNRLQVFKY